MARKIDSLLNKKGWTGVEVGKALVASIVHDIKHQSEPDYKPLFSQSDFNKMEGSLSTERDYLAYGVYRDIYSGLIDAFNKGQAQYQQFYNGYNRYAAQLKDAQIADDMLKKAELIPYVMTEEQYSRLKERATTKLKGFMESFSGLFFTLLSHIMENPEDAPEDIRKAIEATKEEAVTNKRIISSYNETYKHGYCQLPDGTRSDSFEEDGWKKRLIADYLKNHKLYINGELAGWEDTMSHYSTESRLKSYKLFFNGIDAIKTLYKEDTGKDLSLEDEADIMRSFESLIGHGDESLKIALENENIPIHPALTSIKSLVEGELAEGAVWHYYTELPDYVTKYDILEDLEFYNAEGAEPNLKEFKADYPVLYKALETYIKELVPQARDLKTSQYNKDFISWGELAKLEIKEYIKLTTANKHTIADLLAQEDEDTVENLLKRRRISRNVITIAKDPGAYQINENGDFIDNIQDILTLEKIHSIDNIAQSETQRKDLVALQENLIKPALRYIYAFNALVKILGEVYDLEEMGEIELKAKSFEIQLDAFNNILYVFYAGVYGTQKEKDRKRALIKEIFSPIDYEALKPTTKAIEAVTAQLDKLGFSTKTRKNLKKFDNLIDKLCERGL